MLLLIIQSTVQRTSTRIIFINRTQFLCPSDTDISKRSFGVHEDYLPE